MSGIPSSRVAVVVLAAGQGTRFRSDLAKVLHRAAGRTLVRHVLEAVRPLDAGQVVVVVGHQAEAVTADVADAGLDRLDTVVQDQQLGTGHAVQVALDGVGDADWVLIVPGDTPLLTADALSRLLAAVDDDVPAAMLTAHFADPAGYGRVLRADDGTVERIVEHADASEAEREVSEGNAGMYLVRRDLLADALDTLGDDNAQGELYLTDVVAVLRRAGRRVAAVDVDEHVIAGVNDRDQLARAAAALHAAHLRHLMINVGVSVVDPATTHVDVDVEIGRDSVLLPGTLLEAGTTIGERARIGPNTHLTACTVGDDAVVHSTRGEDAVIGAGASVGPFTHLRRATRLGAGARAGAFVELKNVDVGEASKIPHLAYVGDAEVGAGVNLACGVVTVNYDGEAKHHTIVEDGAFVGCDTMLVAPVTIGEGAYTAAGSVITDDVPPGALGIARSRQTNKEGWVARRRG